MPTVKPRVYVTLEPETYEAIRRIAHYSQRSVGGIIGEMAQSSAPVLVQLADTLERAAGLSPEVTGNVRRHLEAAQAKLEASVKGAQSGIDEAQIDLEEYIQRTGSDARQVKRGRLPAAAQGQGGRASARVAP